MSNEVFKNDTSITLDWADVTAANLYHLQVSLEPDFAGSIVEEDTMLATSGKSFTDAGGDNAKRYWRWRYSTDAGTTWSAWSEVGHYWLNTAGAADVSLGSDEVALINPDNVLDAYELPEFPVWRVIPGNMFHAKDRNRKGELLSEWYAEKDTIELEFSDRNYISHAHMREQERFNIEVKTFFLAIKKTNGVDQVPKIWLVQFTEDPAASMIAPGRQDYFTGTYRYEEV